MKKSLLALAVLGAFAGAASAQTSVTVYGKIDLNLSKTSGGTGSMTNGDNSRLGFKGTEDLGGGLAANFVLEQRFDADTGTNENGNRPLFQGASWVGLSSNTLGAIRLGRALTPKQAYVAAFDPWNAARGRGAFEPDLIDAGYVSDPLNGSTTANNRWGNAVFYTSPTFAGLKFDAAVASREGGVVSGTSFPSATPYSLAGGYNNGPIGAFAAYERNALNSKIWQLGASYDFGVAKLMATYSKNKNDDRLSTLAGTSVVNTSIAGSANLAARGLARPGDLTRFGADAKAWTIGAVVPVGPGRLLAGYGQNKFDDNNVNGVSYNGGKAKKGAVGYEYPLSKRTFVYADYINYKTSGIPNANFSTNTVDVGIDHSF